MTIEFVEAWHKNDPKLEAEVFAFWQAQNASFSDPGPQERVKQIAVLAYEDGAMIGLSTLNIRYAEQFRQKLAFIRAIVSNDRRQEHVSIALTQKTRDVIEAYALAHPDEQIGGMGAILQAPGLGKRAIGRGGQMVLAGYTEKNEQIRVAWFDHFLVPANLPTR